MSIFLKKYDKNLLLIIGILTLWGFINFYNVSIPLSIKNYGTPYKYLWEFLLKSIILASLTFLLFSSFKWKTLKKMAFPLFAVSFLFVLLAFLPGFTPAGQTTHRWFNLTNFSFQPTEFLKLALLLWLAFLLPRLQKEFKSPYERSAVLIIIIGVISILILLQPALSNLLIIWATVGIGYLSLKPTLKELTPLFAVLLIFVISSFFWSYRLQRLVSFFTQNIPEKIGFQQEQSKLAIGSGGLWGKGMGNSKVKLIGLPLMINDSIFAIFAEETGFIGSVVLILLFVALILTVVKNVLSISSNEKKFFIYGIATWISFQAFIHIASNIGIIPTTGVPLPFFSDGSSSQIALMAALGIINNIRNS
jgi:cell division protein FtsW